MRKIAKGRGADLRRGRSRHGRDVHCQRRPGSGQPARLSLGAVCVYPQNAGWNNDRPSLVFYSYGAHNLSNQVGQHYVLNNQTGGATARTCTGYNGTGDCQGFIQPGYYVDKDLTPINSILLVRP
ncbi:hypothetical protein [Streptomyces sp. CA-132043]|uniref:hypothetical protein n=1 Tax=Streptomyces sp. CA-132043 TaxID=3240048 RepID=UPI003D90A178